MKSKKQKQEEALHRRIKDLNFWFGFRKPNDPKIKAKMDAAKTDIANLQRKLGMAVDTVTGS